MTPNGWTDVALGEIAAIERNTVAPQQIDDGTTYVGLENITRSGSFVGQEAVSSDQLRSSKFTFSSEHILYGKLRPNLAKIAAPEFSGVSSTDILPIRPGPRVDRRYLLHYLRQPTMIRLAASQTSGINLPRISPKTLQQFRVKFPEALDEQRRIAAALDKATAMERTAAEAAHRLDVLARSTFLETFGHPIPNPRRWSPKPLSQFGTLDRGVSKHRPRNAPELLGGAYPLVQTGDVAGSGGYITEFKSTYSEIGLAQSKLWPAGTLCITIAANIARTAILTFDACFPDSVVGFKTDDLATVQYVRFALNEVQEAIEAAAPQSAQKNINLAVLRGFPLPDPPADLRARFLERLRQIDQMKEQQHRELRYLDELFASLQQRAFRGEL